MGRAEGEFDRRALGSAAQEIAREAADHGHHRADREIEPGREHGQRLRHGDHGQGKNLIGILDENRRGETLGMRQMIEQVDDAEEPDRGDKAGVLAQPDEKIAAGARHERSARR